MTAYDVDAIVIGANLRGLVAAHVLSSLGFRAVILDRSSRLGGIDSSFEVGGATFDHGLHVLDELRSPLTTRLLSRAVAGRVHRVPLAREILVRGTRLPYAPPADAMPFAMSQAPLVDDIGDAPPTRAALARIYGDDFANALFDEILASYPTEARHLAFGVDEAKLLSNVYPWFCPRAERPEAVGDASRRFHDRPRRGVVQHVLYPEEGGFGGFAAGLRAGLDPARIEVVLGAHDLALDVDAPTHAVRAVRAGGRTWRAPEVFWATSWPWLCAELGLPCQDVATDRVVIGSFVLDRPAHGEAHEVLVGDPALHLNRVTWPARFRGRDDPWLQAEFAFPDRDPSWPDDDDAWRARFVRDLTAAGILDADHRLRHADVRSFRLHFNSFGMEGVALQDADPSLLHPASNVRPVVPSMANLNTNAYVPRAVAYVASTLAARGPDEASAP